MKNPSHRAGAKAITAQIHRAHLFIEPLEPRTFLSAVPSGTIDPTFGKGGSALFTAERSLDIKTVAAVPVPKGKMLLLGTTQLHLGNDIFTAALERLNADGSPDKTFGTNGIRLLADKFGTAQSFQDPRTLAVDRSGRIYIAGHTGLIRLKSNGVVDGSFPVTDAASGFIVYYNSIALQHDGDILLGGYYADASSTTGDDGRHNFAVTRIHPNGKPDEHFGDHGRAIITFNNANGRVNSADQALTIDDHGRILAAGGDDGQLDLVRLRRDGSPDPSFGDHGKVVVQGNGLPGSEAGRTASGSPFFTGVSQRASDGEIFAFGGSSGNAYLRGGPVVVASFNPSGLPDLRFGDRGVVRLDAGKTQGYFAPDVIARNALATGITFLRHHRTLVVGSVVSFVGPSGVLLTRLNADGSPDLSFGQSLQASPGAASSQGLRFIPLVGHYSDLTTATLVATTHGRFILPVTNSPVYSNYALFACLRINADGSLDPTYGNAGISTAPINFPDRQTPVRIVSGPDGETYLTLGSDTQARVVALKADGSADASFSLEGSKSHRTSLNINKILIAVQPDGKRLVQVGELIEGVDLVRYNTDGSIDGTYGKNGRVHFGSGFGSFSFDKVLIRADGSLVLSVYFNSQIVPYGPVSETIYSLNATGEIAASFEVPSVNYFGSFSTYRDMTLDENGALLLATNVFQPALHISLSATITRMDAVNLVVDSSYGVGGHVDLPIAPLAITLLSDGRALVSGGSLADDVSSDPPTLTVISTNGTIDTSFVQGPSGLPAGANFVRSGKPLTLHDGKILLILRDDVGDPIHAARFLPDGSLDTTFGTSGLVTLPAGTTAFTLQTTNGIESLLVAGSIKPAQTSPYDTAKSESTAFVQRIAL